jgi:lantibiotic biosynthesis protein
MREEDSKKPSGALAPAAPQQLWTTAALGCAGESLGHGQLITRTEDIKTSSEKVIDLNSPARNFLPGSEWFFAKIYASPSNADRLLLEVIKPLVEKIMAAGEADGWFFIRYADPHWHLRLRFHGDPATLAARVLPALWQALEENRQEGKVWRMQLDTYEREIERYGGLEGVRVAERLFQLDSELVLELLASISDRLGSNLRWQMAFTTVDRLLTGLGFDLDARRNLMNQAGKFQEKNQGANQAYRKQLSEKFRKERATLESLLNEAVAHGNTAAVEFPPTAQAALDRYSRQLPEIHSQLQQAQKQGQLTRTLQELAGSYVHMHLNRIFRSAANAQEMVLYDFLARTYDSKLAREKRVVV